MECYGQSGTAAASSPGTRFFPANYHSTIASYSSVIMIWYNTLIQDPSTTGTQPRPSLTTKACTVSLSVQLCLGYMCRRQRFQSVALS
jgi:hypothetical protein